MTGTAISRKEACFPIESAASPKSIMKIGTWNVRMMYRIGKATVVAREMRKYDINVLGIGECRWAGFGRIRLQTGEIPKHDIVILMGDWNAKVRDQQGGEERVVGHHGLHGEKSENGERIVELCASNNMTIATILFPHKDIHNHTWVSPDAPTKH